MTTPLTILVIDDEVMLRTTMRAYFEDSGFQVVEASDGREGLELFHRVHPDLVFTDLRMPVLDGFGVIEQLNRVSPETPVIVVSGAGTLGDAIRAVRLGAWDYVTKPIHELEELDITARSALERATLIAENTSYREHLEELVRERTARLEESETRYRTLFETSSDAIFLLHDGIVCSANPRAEVLFGCDVAGMSGRSLAALAPAVQPDGSSSEEAFGHRLREAREGRAQQFDWLLRRGDGGTFAAEVSLNRLELDGERYVQAIAHDITERKRYEEDLYHQANYDALTGLPNRNLLTTTLQQFLDDDVTRQGLQVILFDVDNFKHINDVLGHAVGDRLLSWLADILNAVRGRGDFLARFVGDEYVFVRTGEPDDPYNLVRNVTEAMATPFRFGETDFFVTLSAGVALAVDGDTAENLLGNAEVAMFAAKQEGIGAAKLYSREISDRIEAALTLESRLHKALERNEFTLHYQPQIDLYRRAAMGAEALLRWQPQEGPPAPPDHFIPVLERSGLIIPVGEWVIHETCRQVRSWLDQGLPPFRVSVNVTAWHFYSGRLVETVASALAESRLDPGLFCLELTESMIMHDIGETMKTLTRLHDLGIILSIDDFGTGYSSLSYLTRMPIQELKIDRSFILELPESSASGVIVTTILGMADLLNLGVVAEGVETCDQYRYLAGLRCRTLQGFYFSRPLPPADFVSFVREWRTPAA